MKTYLLILNLIFCVCLETVSANSGMYLAPSVNLAYGSGGDDSKNSLLGPSVALAAGVRTAAIGAEMELKQVKITSKQIGNRDYDTEVYDTIFSGGVRLFLDNIFSLKFGFAQHFVEMEIEKNDNRIRSEEDDGSYFGLYGGMGIIHPLTKSSEVFLESTLYPISDIDLYVIDMQLGLRILL